MKTLSRQEARRVYDRIGRFQDSQAFYEDRATNILIEQGRFETARHVFEFGCGTGRLAARLLSDRLPDAAVYEAVDLSSTMVGLAEERLAAFGPRATVRHSDGSPRQESPDACCDRFLSTYVLDLLSDEDITAVLDEAHRMLEPGGLLCLTSLSTGQGGVSRAIVGLWSALHRLSPALVGGCRPIELASRLASGQWKIRYDECVTSFGVPSEIVVAERAG